MAKLITFMFLMIGVVLLFHFGGLIEDTPNSTLIQLALNPEGITSSNVYLLVIGLLTTVGSIAVIVIGAVTKTDFIIFAGIIPPLLTLGWDFLIIFNVFAAINIFVALLIMSPIFIVYIITVLEWWRGIST